MKIENNVREKDANAMKKRDLNLKKNYVGVIDWSTNKPGGIVCLEYCFVAARGSSAVNVFIPAHHLSLLKHRKETAELRNKNSAR